MKTTLDIPDSIFRQAKSRAALRGFAALEDLHQETRKVPVSPRHLRLFKVLLN